MRPLGVCLFLSMMSLVMAYHKLFPIGMITDKTEELAQFTSIIESYNPDDIQIFRFFQHVIKLYMWTAGYSKEEIKEVAAVASLEKLEAVIDKINLSSEKRKILERMLRSDIPTEKMDFLNNIMMLDFSFWKNLYDKELSEEFNFSIDDCLPFLTQYETNTIKASFETFLKNPLEKNCHCKKILDINHISIQTMIGTGSRQGSILNPQELYKSYCQSPYYWGLDKLKKLLFAFVNTSSVTADDLTIILRYGFRTVYNIEYAETSSDLTYQDMFNYKELATKGPESQVFHPFEIYDYITRAEMPKSIINTVVLKYLNKDDIPVDVPITILAESMFIYRKLKSDKQENAPTVYGELFDYFIQLYKRNKTLKDANSLLNDLSSYIKKHSVAYCDLSVSIDDLLKLNSEIMKNTTVTMDVALKTIALVAGFKIDQNYEQFFDGMKNLAQVYVKEGNQ